MDDYCCFGDVRRDVAREEVKESNGKQYVYRCLKCGYEVRAHLGNHYCPNCSTEFSRIPLARMQEE